MKSNITHKPLATLCMALAIFTTGCIAEKEGGKRIENIEVEVKAPLIQEELESPACKVTANLAHFKEKDENDSIAHRINQEIIAISLGDKYRGLTPDAAVDSFKNEYILSYRREVNEFYQEDIKNADDKKSIPSWYNYEFMLTTELKEGKEGVFNYTSTIMEYRGGAHPNQWSKWVNFGKVDGKQILLDELFIPGYKTPVSALILKSLIPEMAEKLNDPTIQSLNDLQNNGILSYTDIYVPDNFLLEKEGIAFLYNKYDIAPYAMGAIVVTIPYSELESFLIH